MRLCYSTQLCPVVPLLVAQKYNGACRPTTTRLFARSQATKTGRPSPFAVCEGAQPCHNAAYKALARLAYYLQALQLGQPRNSLRLAQLSSRMPNRKPPAFGLHCKSEFRQQNDVAAFHHFDDHLLCYASCLLSCSMTPKQMPASYTVSSARSFKPPRCSTRGRLTLGVD